MDDADIANDRALWEMERRLQELRSKPRLIAPEMCVDCDEPNAPARRALGLPRCIDCQRFLEVRSRSHASNSASG
jgi:hypothetical protein